MLNYIVSNAELTAISNAIRQLSNTNALITWQTDLGFATSIEALQPIITLNNIYVKVQPNKKIYEPEEAFDPTGMVVCANYTFGENVIENVVIDNNELSFSLITSSSTIVTITYNQATTTIPIIVFNNTSLNETSWDIISKIAKAGLGDVCWDIGDCKALSLQGTMGTLNLNTTLYVFILDFNHPIDKTTPDNNIIFGGFKTALTEGADVALCDDHYGSTNISGAKWFNMNHYNCAESGYGCNYGGWKGCDMRYDILGATSTPPSEYGGQKTTSNIGYDATVTTISSPVTNTLMSCLPSNFRNVLRLWTKYVDNTGNASNVNANVTAVVDAISLLSEYEIFGKRSYSNQYEQDYQKQMAYYIAGNSKIKYHHSDNTQAIGWWWSSPRYDNAYRFCGLNNSGKATTSYSRLSFGVAPAFKV